MVFERDIPSCSPREVLIQYLRRALIWWDHPQIDGNFPLLLTLHEEPLKPVRHLGKDVPISKVNQLSFPAGKKCNGCQFRFGLGVYKMEENKLQKIGNFPGRIKHSIKLAGNSN